MEEESKSFFVVVGIHIEDCTGIQDYSLEWPGPQQCFAAHYGTCVARNPRAVCYLDDILISEKDDQQHSTNLEAVLKRLQDFGLRLKRNKCQWIQSKVEYLGYCIQAQGLSTAPQKI